MAVVSHNEEEEEEEEEEVDFQKSNNMVILPTTLASIESLTFPLVQEVVVLADFRCKNCQDRVADIVSRMNGEAESLEISVMEKKVTLTLTRKHPGAGQMPGKELQVAAICKNSVGRFSSIRRLFRTSCN